MAKATTEQFSEMVIEVETTGAALPVAQLVTNLTAAAAALVTVADGTKFTAGGQVNLSIPGANSSFSGIYNVTSIAANVLTTSFNSTSITGGPLTQTNAPNMSATPGLGASLVWSKLCGLTSRTVTRTTTMQTTEVPDCIDETLPNSIEKAVQSQEQTISGTGVWAAESHGTMMSWWRAGTRKGVRVANVKAPTGTVLYEWGYAFLTQLNNTAAKGTKVTADIQVEFDGVPGITNAP